MRPHIGLTPDALCCRPLRGLKLNVRTRERDDPVNNIKSKTQKLNLPLEKLLCSRLMLGNNGNIKYVAFAVKCGRRPDSDSCSPSGEAVLHRAVIKGYMRLCLRRRRSREAVKEDSRKSTGSGTKNVPVLPKTQPFRSARRKGRRVCRPLRGLKHYILCILDFAFVTSEG
jgi:hypothetical protein